MGRNPEEADASSAEVPGNDITPSEPPRPLLPPPSQTTAAGKAYFDTFAETFRLFCFIVDLTLKADWTGYVLREALEGRTTYKEWTPSHLAIKRPGPHVRELRQRRQALLEMILVRTLDSFTTYVSEVIREALRAKPEMLRSRETVRLDYLLHFTDMDDLREDLIDRTVMDLSYKGFSNLEDWCSSRMDIKLVGDTTARSKIIELIETRNVIVHNRGVVGPKYLRIVADSRFTLGTIRELTIYDMEAAFELLVNVATGIDEEIATKYDLVRFPYGPTPETENTSG